MPRAAIPTAGGIADAAFERVGPLGQGAGSGVLSHYTPHEGNAPIRRLGKDEEENEEVDLGRDHPRYDLLHPTSSSVL